MSERTWIPVTLPLYVARTGIHRTTMSAVTGKDRGSDNWFDMLESAESGLEYFCKPHRVYALEVTNPMWPGYLTMGGYMLDCGRPRPDLDNDEVLLTGETAEEAEAEAQKFVTTWIGRAKAELAKLPDVD